MWSNETSIGVEIFTRERKVEARFDNPFSSEKRDIKGRERSKRKPGGRDRDNNRIRILLESLAVVHAADVDYNHGINLQFHHGIPRLIPCLSYLVGNFAGFPSERGDNRFSFRLM